MQRRATPDLRCEPPGLGDQRAEKGAPRSARGRSNLGLIRHLCAAVGTTIVLARHSAGTAVGGTLRATVGSAVGAAVVLAGRTGCTTVGGALGSTIRAAVLLTGYSARSAVGGTFNTVRHLCLHRVRDDADVIAYRGDANRRRPDHLVVATRGCATRMPQRVRRSAPDDALTV